MIEIRPHRASDDDARSALLDEAMGPDRKKKTAYRLREGVPAIEALSFDALGNDGLCGTIRFWPAQVRPSDGSDPVPVIILGPLAVRPDLKGQGIGLGLMKRGLEKAKYLGHRIVVLVGDPPYYARVGFKRQGAEGLSLPGPVDPSRLLILELQPGAADGIEGMIEKWPGDNTLEISNDRSAAGTT